LADHLQLAAQPGFELIDDDAAFVLAHRASLVRAAAADGRLDLIEHVNARQGLAGNGRRAGCGEFVEAAAHMRPAKRQELTSPRSAITRWPEYPSTCRIPVSPARCAIGRSALRSGA